MSHLVLRLGFSKYNWRNGSSHEKQMKARVVVVRIWPDKYDELIHAHQETFALLNDVPKKFGSAVDIELWFFILPVLLWSLSIFLNFALHSLFQDWVIFCHLLAVSSFILSPPSISKLTIWLPQLGSGSVCYYYIWCNGLQTMTWTPNNPPQQAWIIASSSENWTCKHVGLDRFWSSESSGAIRWLWVWRVWKFLYRLLGASKFGKFWARASTNMAP